MAMAREPTFYDGLCDLIAEESFNSVSSNKRQRESGECDEIEKIESKKAKIESPLFPEPVHVLPASVWTFGEHVMCVDSVVVTINLRGKLNLAKLALYQRDFSLLSERERKLVIINIPMPKCTVLVLCTGKAICYGTKSEAQVEMAIKQFRFIMRRVGYNIVILDYKIQNIFASCRLDFPVDLEELRLKHPRFSPLKAGLEPILANFMANSSVVVMISANGNVILTGAKKESEILEAFEQVIPMLM